MAIIVYLAVILFMAAVVAAGNRYLGLVEEVQVAQHVAAAGVAIHMDQVAPQVCNQMVGQVVMAGHLGGKVVPLALVDQRMAKVHLVVFVLYGPVLPVHSRQHA